MKGYPWQSVLAHRVELGEIPTGATGGAAIWGSSTWGGGAVWAEGWAPVFRDVTHRLLSAHSNTGAQGLGTAPGVGTVELELLDLDGALSPGGSVDWLLGRHVRGFVTPQGRPEVSAFYGIIDKAAAQGSFAVPTVALTAYDTRSIVAASETPGPVADVAQAADVRLRAVLTAAGIDAAHIAVQADPTALMADDTLELGDLFGRTVESAAGLAWADGAGRIVTRNRDWVHGMGSSLAAYIYAGAPISTPAPGVPVCQTTELAAAEAISTVANWITYANRDDPPTEVTEHDPASINRYGMRRDKVTDLSCDVALLSELAVRAVALRSTPPLVVDAATVTVYDANTAAAAALELGAVVAVGRNDPDAASWELVGVIIGRDLSITPDRFEVSLTVTDAAGLGGAGSTDAVWGTGHWGTDRWAAA